MFMYINVELGVTIYIYVTPRDTNYNIILGDIGTSPTLIKLYAKVKDIFSLNWIQLLLF